MKLKTLILIGLFALSMMPVCAHAEQTVQEEGGLNLPEQMPTNDEVEDMETMEVPSTELVDYDESSPEEDLYEVYYVLDDGEGSDEYVSEEEEAYEEELELTPSGEEAKLPNPKYVVQSIRVTGNCSNSRERILKMLGVKANDRLTMDQLEEARVRLAMSGLFSGVDMKLRPGSERGSLSIELHVDERSHIQVNRYFLGTSTKSPFWLGLDTTYLAPFGTNHRFRMAFGATTSNDYTLSMNYLVPTIANYPVSLMFSVQSLHSHEDVYGPSYFSTNWLDIDEPHPFDYLDKMVFERHGASVGVGYAPHEFIRLMLRIEYMNLLRQNDDYQVSQYLDDYLKPRQSNLTAVEMHVAYDSRGGRELPNRGHFVMLGLKGTANSAASDYNYFRVNVAHQSNFNVAKQHVIRVHSFAGAVLGEAPFFEKFFFNDFYTLASSRFQMLNPSSRGAYDLFKTGASGLSYEDFLVHLGLTYAWQPFERRAEIFFSIGATWADSLDDKSVYVGVQPEQKRDDFPADISANVGVRFKTDYGMFSISLSNFIDLVAR